jgi:hypothetical protein
MRSPDPVWVLRERARLLARARLACAALREEEALPDAPRVLLRLADRLLESLGLPYR